MNDLDVVNLGNAVRALNSMIATNEKFLKHCQTHPKTLNLDVELRVDNKTLSVSGFTYEATAKGRYVLGAKGFAAEYVFKVGTEPDSAVEVWRCYVEGMPEGMSGSALFLDPDLTQRVCDAMNTRVVDQLCFNVASGIRSAMFNAAKASTNT